MIIKIQPSKIQGEIIAPASKSSMQRACAAALVRNGISVISNPGISNDDKAALNIIKNLGAKWEVVNDKLIITSEGVKPISNEVNCGESGLSIRMFSPIVALSEREITVTGTGSLLTRPMDFFDEVLPQLDIKIKSNNGKLPLQIKGPLQPKNITIDGSLSSQFLTGLLMAYSVAPLPPEGGAYDKVIITVKNLKSRPYIDLTLKVMQDFRLRIPENKNYEEFIFNYKNASKAPPLEGFGEAVSYTVEGDWSGAAFLLVAGAIASTNGIKVKGLDINSTQADKKILEALKDCGCNLSINNSDIKVSYPPLGVRGFHFDATDCPDLFPPLVALASYCDGTTTIKGVNRLAHKESNRGLTLQKEFKKMGVEIELQDNLMIVKGSAIKGSITHSHHDHRIAMACAVAGLNADGETIIEEADAINKSYPNFYEHLKMLGASVSSIDKQLNKTS